MRIQFGKCYGSDGFFSAFWISSRGMNVQLPPLYYSNQGMAELLNGKALVVYDDLGCYVF